MRIGTILEGRYSIEKVLGQGGQGTVYLARDRNLNMPCAIKEIDLRLPGKINLLAEPEILKQLRHPKLPRINDIIRDQDYMYIIEEYFEGRNLKDLIVHRDICSEENVIRWAKELAQILQYLHSLKPLPIIYRDMKPANIIIDQEGSVKLIDFGIAREYKAGHDSDTVYIGTRGYAAPEQYGSNQTDERTDIYALGVTLYHVLTGRNPSDPPYEILPIRQVNPGFSEGMERIIARCTCYDPAQRYQSAAELLQDLDNIHTLNRQYRRGQMRKKVIAGLIACLVIGGALAFYYHLQSQESAREAQYDKYIQAGMEAFDNYDFTHAEENFTQALKLYPRDEAYLNLARTYLWENKNDKAINYLQDLLNQGKIRSGAETDYILGTAFFNREDYQKALMHFDRVVTSESNVAGEDRDNAYRDLAVSYARIGDYGKAREIMEEIKADSGKNPVANYINGEICLLQGEYNGARQDFAAALSMDPQNPRYKLSLAQIYLLINKQGISPAEKTGNYSQAIRLLNEISPADNEYIHAQNELGQACYEQGLLYESQGNSNSQTMFQDSLVAFKKIIDIGAEDCDLLLNVGILQEKLDNRKEADQSYSRALELDTNNSRANLVYGLFLLKSKQYSEACQYLQRTVELNRNPAEVATAQSKINELREKGWI